MGTVPARSDLLIPISISGDILPDQGNGMTRYEFELFSSTGVKRAFIVDVPEDSAGRTDVWVLDSVVEVGDTPQDGFATFTPA